MNKKAIALLATAAIFLTACAPKTEDLQGKFSSKSKIPASTLTIKTAPDTAKDQLVYAGQEDVLLGTYYVKATGEDFNVDRLTLEIVSPDGEDSVSSIRIKYPTELSSPTNLDGDMVANFVGGTVKFDDLEFMVPKDNDTVAFEVYANINTHTQDSGTADSGDKIQLTINRKADLKAIGQDSGTTLTTSSIVSSAAKTNTSYVFRTLPEIEVIDQSGGLLEYGTAQEVFGFSLNYINTGAIRLREIGLDVSSSGLLTDTSGLGGTWSLVTNGGDVYGSSSYSAGRVEMPVWGNPSSPSSGPYSGAGEFFIWAPVVDDGIDNTNSLSVRIGEDKSALFNKSVPSNYGEAVKGDLVGASFVWADENVSTPTFWHNGYKVSGLPTSYITMQ